MLHCFGEGPFVQPEATILPADVPYSDIHVEDASDVKESSDARLTPSLAAYLLPALARSERNRASAARTHETAPAWPQHSGLGGRAQFPASLWPWPVHHWPRGRDASTSIVCAAYLGPEKFSSFVASLMAQTPPSCLHPPPLFHPPQSRLPPLSSPGRVVGLWL